VLPLSRFYRDGSRKDGLNARCKDCAQSDVNKWRAKNPETLAVVNRRWRVKNMARSNRATRAQRQVRMAITAGLLARPEACEACGSVEGRIEAAHYDYDEPLRVRWLCMKCHRRWDSREPKS